jgi:hypothetical protein
MLRPMLGLLLQSLGSFASNTMIIKEVFIVIIKITKSVVINSFINKYFVNNFNWEHC